MYVTWTEFACFDLEQAGYRYFVIPYWFFEIINNALDLKLLHDMINTEIVNWNDNSFLLPINRMTSPAHETPYHH